jgi:hypothetical protein
MEKSVILRTILLKVSGQEKEGLGEHSGGAKVKSDEETANTSVAIEKGMNRFKLVVK